jgi:hypothetical protein
MWCASARRYVSTLLTQTGQGVEKMAQAALAALGVERKALDCGVARWQAGRYGLRKPGRGLGKDGNHQAHTPTRGAFRTAELAAAVLP